MYVCVCAKLLTVDRWWAGSHGGPDCWAHCIMSAMKKNACSAILTVCITVALSEVAGLYDIVYNIMLYYIYIYKSQEVNMYVCMYICTHTHTANWPSLYRLYILTACVHACVP